MRRLNETTTISPQLMRSDLSALSAGGVEALVCARPDGEAPNQPAADLLGKAAEEVGLAFLHLPVTPGQLPSDQDARAYSAFARGRKVHVYCAHGPRAILLASLAAAAEGRRLSVIKQDAEGAGIDLTPIEGVLVDRGAEVG
jgi:sulfide:quinone oxidoreductase